MIYALIMLIATILFITASLLFQINLWVLFPLFFLFIALYQITSHYFWDVQKFCPRCHAPITIYAEFCKNCGLNLIHKCPSCGRYFKSGMLYCANCGYKSEYLEQPKAEFPYQIMEKGMVPPEKANFCPTCGVKLPVEQNLNYCETCGSKIE